MRRVCSIHRLHSARKPAILRSSTLYPRFEAALSMQGMLAGQARCWRAERVAARQDIANAPAQCLPYPSKQTSQAIASKDGTLRPNAVAVFILMTSSNLVLNQQIGRLRRSDLKRTSLPVQAIRSFGPSNYAKRLNEVRPLLLWRNVLWRNVLWRNVLWRNDLLPS